MDVKRVVNSSIWTDDNFTENFTPEDKLMMFYLWTNTNTTQIGIYKLNIKIAACCLGFDKYTAKAIIKRLETIHHAVVFDEETHEILIRHYLYDSLLAGGKPVRNLLRKEINQTASTMLLKILYEDAADVENLSDCLKGFVASDLYKRVSSKYIDISIYKDYNYYILYYDSDSFNKDEVKIKNYNNSSESKDNNNYLIEPKKPTTNNEIVSYYVANTDNKINGGNQKALIKLVSLYGIKQVKKAIRTANENGKTNIGYIRAILKKWEEGITLDAEETKASNEAALLEGVAFAEKVLHRKRFDGRDDEFDSCCASYQAYHDKQ